MVTRDLDGVPGPVDAIRATALITPPLARRLRVPTTSRDSLDDGIEHVGVIRVRVLPALSNGARSRFPSLRILPSPRPFGHRTGV